MSENYDLQKSVFSSNGDIDANYRVTSIAERDALITSSPIKIHHIIAFDSDDVPEFPRGRYELVSYPTIGNLEGVVWSKVISSTTLAAIDSYSGEDLHILSDNSQLIPGKKYVMNNYRHIDVIQNTNTTPKLSSYTQKSWFGGNYIDFGEFNSDLEQPLEVGDVMTILELPLGYVGSLSVGDTATIISIFDNYFLQFDGSVSTETIGTVWSAPAKPRFSNIPNNSTINDANGKPIMKPGGVLNIEVYDDTAYMDMSATENKSVGYEQIVLTAINNKEFDKNAYSLTHINDLLEFDFNSTDVLSDTGDVVGNRLGIVTRRYNNFLNIDLPLDWREVKFRRWLFDDNEKLKLVGRNLESTKDDIDNYLYKDGDLMFTSSQFSDIVANEERFYLALGVEGNIPVLDRKGSVNLENYLISDLTKAKDFYTIPLDDFKEPKNSIIKIKSNVLENSIIKDFAGSGVVEIDCNIDEIKESTFSSGLTGGKFNVVLDNIISLDNINLFDSINSGIKDVVSCSNIVYNLVGSSLDKVYVATTLGGSFLNYSSIGTTYLEVRCTNTNFSNSSIGGRFSAFSFIDSNFKNESIFSVSYGIFDNQINTFKNCNLRNHILRILRFSGGNLFSNLTNPFINPNDSDGWVYEISNSNQGLTENIITNVTDCYLLGTIEDNLIDKSIKYNILSIPNNCPDDYNEEEYVIGDRVPAFEFVTEGDNTGIRIASENPANHGDIGNNAIDLTFQSNPGDKGATGPLCIAFGQDAEASESVSVAIGTGARAIASNAVAIGTGATSSGNVSFALGNGSNVAGDSSTAIGNGTNCTSLNTVAIGQGAQATAQQAFALGVANQANGEDSISIGLQTRSNETNSISIGSFSQSNGNSAIALGSNSQSSSDNSISIGVGSNTPLGTSIAIGAGALAVNGGIALGAGVQATGNIFGELFINALNVINGSVTLQGLQSSKPTDLSKLWKDGNYLKISNGDSDNSVNSGNSIFQISSEVATSEVDDPEGEGSMTVNRVEYLGVSYYSYLNIEIIPRNSNNSIIDLEDIVLNAKNESVLDNSEDPVIADLITLPSGKIKFKVYIREANNHNIFANVNGVKLNTINYFNV